MINLFTIITQRKYFAVAQLFLSLSLIFGTWVIYIPTISDRLQLTEGRLGIVLLFGAIGALTALPLGKYSVTKFGEGMLAMLSIIVYALAVFGNFMAGSYVQLCFFLFLNGFSASFLQIGINSIVATLENEENISIMSSCHGFYSLGGILSAGFGTMLLIVFNNPIYHIVTMLAIVVMLQILFMGSYLKHKNEIISKTSEVKISIKNLKNPALFGLAFVGLCVMVSEGAIADWSALYLRNVVMTNAEIVGLGYAGFSVTMTIGRFMGDYICKRFGPWQLIIGGYIISVIGLSIVLICKSVNSIGGFALVGLGISSIVPEIYRLSTKIDGVNPSTGIAFMAGAGFFGFLAGPVALGAIAEKMGLQFSFATILILLMVGTLFASFISYSKYRVAKR